MEEQEIVVEQEFVEEEQNSTTSKFEYHGEAIDLFKIFIVNIFLLIITFGLYYPWAKAKMLNFHYAATEFKGNRFTFHGTGREMFGGLIKALLIFGAWSFLFNYTQTYLLEEANQTGVFWPFAVTTIVFYLILFCIMPLAIVGSLKYRASRSSWRGIHFQYVGTVEGMYKVMLPGIVLTFLTFGIYGFWLIVNIYKEVASNLRWGTLKFDFKGKGGELCRISILGIILSYLTFFIYMFKFMSQRHNFLMNNVHIEGEGEQAKLLATTSGRGFLKLGVGNFFIVLFSLGLAIPYAIVRTIKYITATFVIEGDVDFDNLQQGDLTDANAVGEGLMDALEIDLI